MNLTQEQKIRFCWSAGALVLGIGCGILIEKRSYERQMTQQIQQQVFGAFKRPEQDLSDPWKEKVTQKLDKMLLKLQGLAETLKEKTMQETSFLPSPSDVPVQEKVSETTEKPSPLEDFRPKVGQH